MLRSAGCYPAFLQDVEQERRKLLNDAQEARVVYDEDRSCSVGRIDQEWLMSKRLSTECRLSPTWRGSSLRRDTGHSHLSFVLVETVDFRKLLSLPSAHESVTSGQRQFIVSTCNKYLLLIVQKEIFIYSLVEPRTSLQSIVRLVAGRKVITASMDTSSGRQSVSALLEGRIGMVWDLNERLSSSKDVSSGGEPLDLGFKTDVHGLTTLGASKLIPMQVFLRATDTFDVLPHTLPRVMTAPEPRPDSLYSPDETVDSLHGVVSCHTESPESTAS